VPGLRSAATPRFAWAALLVAILALRLVTPVGFMPAFDHGAVTIVACTDADGGAPVNLPHHHHHGGPKTLHQPCPFAAGLGLGALAADFFPLLEVLIFTAALLLGRTFLFLERHGARERPPTRAPPFPA
jgi:hypothetical protein